MSSKELKLKKHVPYRIDFEYLDVKVAFFFQNEKNERKQFSEIVLFFEKMKIIESITSSFSDTFEVKCEEGEYTIYCENLIGRQVLAILLELQRQGKSIHSTWYLCDYHSCNEHPQFIHSFFLADNYQIIAESIDISTSWMDDCDLNILIDASPSEPMLWSNENQNVKAITLWYYQKFYQETKIGQILCIRDSFPNAKNIFPIQNQFQVDKKLKWILIGTGLIILKLFF